MKELIQAELLKLRTTRTIYGATLAALVVGSIALTGTLMSAGKSGGTPSLSTGEGIRAVMSAGSADVLAVLIIGILIMAGEFRHGTVTLTFLVSPKRERVVAAKIVASAFVGALIAAATAALTLALSVPWMEQRRIPLHFLSHDVGVVLLGGIVASVIYAVIGVGVGSVIRNQTTAVIVSLAWVLGAESLLVSFVPQIGKWVPSAAGDALDASGKGLLPMWAGAVIFAGYGLLFAFVGICLTVRRDVA